MQVRLLRSLLLPAGGAVLPLRRRRLHHLLPSVRAARLTALPAGGRPSLPGPSVSGGPPSPERHPAPLRLHTVRQLEVWRSARRQPPGHPQLLREQSPGGVPEPGRTVQRLQTCGDGVHAGLH